MIFETKYNFYKQQYSLINEADQDETTQIKFLTTIEQIRSFVDPFIQNNIVKNLPKLTDVVVYQFLTDEERKSRVKQLFKEHCNVSISHISGHGIYGCIYRENTSLIQSIFNANKDQYFQFCKDLQMNPSKRIKHTLPPTTTYKNLTNTQIQILKNAITDTLTKIQSVLPSIISEMFTNKNFGVELNELGKCKVIVKNKNLTFGVFTEIQNENTYTVDVGNVYPTQERDFQTNYKLVYVLE